MKIVIFMFYLVFVSLLLFEISPNKDWCWTKSMVNDPSYVFNPKNGGVNWGYCSPKSNKPKEIKYKVDIITSSLPESGTK